MIPDGVRESHSPIPVTVGRPSVQGGVLNGESVAVLPSHQALDLTFAAEEIGMSVATLRERSLRDLEPRALQGPHLPGEEELQRQWLAVGGGDTAALDEQAGRLLDFARERLPLLEEVARRASDPSRQHLLLAAALRLARARGAAYGQAAERIADALEELEEESGPQVRAGLNTSGQARAFARTTAGQDAFRAAYRDAVLLAETMPRMFNLVLQRFGRDRFEDGVALLIAALAGDLSSVRPSVEPVRLNVILSDLYLLQACSSVLEVAKQACTRMRASVKVSDTRLAGALVETCTDDGASPRTFEVLLDEFGVHEDAGARMFINEVLGVLREMPTKVFNSPEHRLAVIDAAQQTLCAHTPNRPQDV